MPTDIEPRGVRPRSGRAPPGRSVGLRRAGRRGGGNRLHGPGAVGRHSCRPCRARAALGAHPLPGRRPDRQPRAGRPRRLHHPGRLRRRPRTARNNWDRAGSAGVALAAHAYYSVVETEHPLVHRLPVLPPARLDRPPVLRHRARERRRGRAARRRARRLHLRRAARRRSPSRTPTSSPTCRPAATGPPAARASTAPCAQASPHDGVPHPVTAQEAKGHGLKARPHYDINGDGVVYYPSLPAAEVARAAPTTATCATSWSTSSRPVGCGRSATTPRLFAELRAPSPATPRAAAARATSLPHQLRQRALGLGRRQRRPRPRRRWPPIRRGWSPSTSPSRRRSASTTRTTRSRPESRT